MLDLNDLIRDCPGIGAALAQAGAICLESQNHTPGVVLAIRGNAAVGNTYRLDWTSTASRGRALWQCNQATEWGAAAVAILLVNHATPYQVVEASRLGTGIDFWLGDDSDLIFQRKARLEVSGIRSDSDAAIAQRVIEKLNQTTQSDHSQTTAYVIVVEFSQPVAEVRVK